MVNSTNDNDNIYYSLGNVAQIMWQVIRGPRHKMWDFVANLKSGDYQLIGSG